LDYQPVTCGQSCDPEKENPGHGLPPMRDIPAETL
jgi:hypothetical protein